MNINDRQARAFTDGQEYEQSPDGSIRWSCNGYPATAGYTPAGVQVRISVVVKDTADMAKNLYDLFVCAERMDKVRSCIYQGAQIVITLCAGRMVKLGEPAAACLRDLTAGLSALGCTPGPALQPPQAADGAGVPLAAYETLDPGLKKKENLLAGLAGALLGALIGSLLWVLASQLGYIAGIAGLVMAVLALKGYEKLGGALSTAGCLLSVAIVFVVIYFAQNVCYCIEIYKALQTEYDISFMDAYRALPLFMEDAELRGWFWRELLVGYALTAIASFSFIRAGITAGTLNVHRGCGNS